MRHIVVAIVILSIIVSLGVLECRIKEKALDDMISICDDMVMSIDNNDAKMIKDNLEKLDNYYHKHRRELELFFSHDEFKEIPMLIGELRGTISNGNFRESKVRIEVLKYEIENIRELITPNLSSIL